MQKRNESKKSRGPSMDAPKNPHASQELTIPEIENEKNESEGQLSHRSLQAPIKQSDMTIFKINPIDWNNVPKIVYDAICSIITSYDNLQSFQNKQNRDMQRDHHGLRKVHDTLEKTVQESDIFYKEEMNRINNSLLEKNKLLHGELIDKQQRMQILIREN